MLIKRTGINWFKLNRALHRDIGYFCIGMTLVFAISGIALNHINDWNSNYSVTQKSYNISLVSKDVESKEFESWLLNELKISIGIKARFWQDSNIYKLFYENGSITINKNLETVIVEQIKPRVLLRSLNFLHLNEAKKAWVYFSDFYALMLIFLSISALFMVKGKYSAFKHRGCLVLIGLATPAGFVIFYAS